MSALAVCTGPEGGARGDARHGKREAGRAWIMRLSHPMGVTQLRSQASSLWACRGARRCCEAEGERGGKGRGGGAAKRLRERRAVTWDWTKIVALAGSMPHAM